MPSVDHDFRVVLIDTERPIMRLKVPFHFVDPAGTEFAMWASVEEQ
jgi:predicted enzyme related to lactoylglutathione lyase